MSDREDQIARIQQIERIKALEAQGSAPEENSAEPPGALATSLNALDYQRAHTGGPAIARVLEKLTGNPVARNVDWGKIHRLEAPFPGTAEMIDEAMGPEAKPLTDADKVKSIYDVPTLFDATRGPGMARNITKMGVGVVGDIASDPATYESMGMSALARLKNLGKLTPLVRGVNAIVNPVEEFMKWRGNANYGKAFEKMDEIGIDKGKPYAVSKILQDRGFSGNARKAAQEIRNVNKEAGAEIGRTLDEATAQGAGVDPFKLVGDAWTKAQELKATGIKELQALGDNIMERAMELWRTHGPTIPANKANELKTALDKQIKEAGFAAGEEASIAKQGQKHQANALREGVDTAVNATDPQLGKEYREANKMFASTDKGMYKKARNWARSAPEMRGPFDLTATELMLASGIGGGSYAYGGNPLEGAAGALLLTKAGRALMSTAGRTMRGKAATTLGRVGMGLLDPTVRQAPRSVWEAMQQGDQ